ncbi:MAG: hypothetical protein ACR2G4_02460 [Pyrinomonadaceae bacterium]
MRNLITLLLLGLLSPTIASAQVKTDRERDGLKGLVRAVRAQQMTVISEDEKQTESPLLMSHVITYDKAGSRTELALFDEAGALNRRIVYTYGAQSKKPSELITYDAHSIMMRKIVDTYGSNGFKSNRAIYDYHEDGTLYRKTVLTFNASGELAEAADYREDGSLIKKDKAPFKHPAPSSKARRNSNENEDRIVSFGGARGEFFEPDSSGNLDEGDNILNLSRLFIWQEN